MNIGKREQIVIGVVSALVLIGGLDLFLFAPARAGFQQAQRSRDEAAGSVSNLKTLAKPEDLANFTHQTDRFLGELSNGLKGLDLHEPEEFTLTTFDTMKEKPPEGTKPEDMIKVKKKLLAVENWPKVLVETGVVLQEIEKLRSYLTNPGESQTQLTFLNNPADPDGSWQLTATLPPNLQGPALWDLLRQIAETKSTLTILGPDSSSYGDVEKQYSNLMRQLRIDKDRVDEDKKFGEFVPLIYRLSVASSILQQMKNPDTPKTLLPNRAFDREFLFEILDASMPGDLITGLKVNKMYFLYEELRYLNEAIKLANELGVKQISRVEFRGYAVLRQMDDHAEPGPRPTASVAKNANGMMEFPTDEGFNITVAAIDPALDAAGAAGGGAPYGGGGGGSPYQRGGGWAPGGMNMQMGENANTPTPTPTPELDVILEAEKDMGFALPIKMTLVGDNGTVWTYIYETLRRRRMAELFRLEMHSVSSERGNTASPDVVVAPTFLFVPSLFQNDEVQKIIAEMNPTTTTQTLTPPPGAGAPGQPQPGS